MCFKVTVKALQVFQKYEGGYETLDLSTVLVATSVKSG